MHIFSREFGALAAAYEAVDWAATPLGPVESWSGTLLGTVDLMMHTPFPVSLLWGDELRLVYNEAFVSLIGDKHPTALGRPVREVAPESYAMVGHLMRSVLQGEAPVLLQDTHVPLDRSGFLEECYFTFSYSPVRGPGGAIGGVMNIAVETTVQVLARRRVELLGTLAEQLAGVSRTHQVAAVALPVLQDAAADLTEVAVHLPGRGAHAWPDDWTGTMSAPPERPVQAATSREFMLHGPSARQVWLPLTPPGTPPGHLVVVPSPQLQFDREYHDFLRLIAALLRQTLDRVRSRDELRPTGAPVVPAQPAVRPPTSTTARPAPGGGTPAAGGCALLAVRHRPASRGLRRGGDWYDWFDLPTGSLAVAVGDLDDPQEPDDVALTRARLLLRGGACACPEAGPGELLTGLDHAIAVSSPGTLGTALLALVTPTCAGLEVRWSNAGHPPPLVLRRDGEVTTPAGTSDAVLGVDPSTLRGAHTVTLSPGDTLVLCSDGLLARRHSALTSGIAWLAGTLRGLADLSVEDLAEHVLGKSGQPEDDVVLVVLRCPDEAGAPAE